MGAVFFHGLGDVLPALLASFALYCGVIVVGAFACLVTLLCYIKHKQGETMVYMEKFPGRTEPIPMLTTWSIHRTLSKEAHRLDVGTHLFQLSAGFSRMYQKHGMLRFYDATHPILAVFKADHIEELLTSNTILKKGHEYDLLGPWLGTGLLTRYYNGLHDQCSKQPAFGLCSSHPSVIRERKDELLSCPELQESLEETSLESDIYDVKGKTRKPFLDILLREHIKDPKNFTEEDVREEVDTFMFEGHDTTAMGMSWALYLIGLYSEHQELMHQELDSIFGDDQSRPITSEDLKQMKYMECCLKESQRLYPSVPFITRTCEQDVMIAGRKLPKGADIQVGIYSLHRDPEVFPKPEEFIPDRFLPENVKGRHPFAFVPFSAGPRNCIGQRFAMMEEKVVIANILRNYKLVSLHHRDKIRVMAELVLRPKSGLHVNFIPREPKKLK
nr:cytochrome P450 4c3-like isoform X4 [Dermacentor andersoni]